MKFVRKVIDIGAAQAPMLGDYLSKSSKNFIVICDAAQMEMLKGDAILNIRKSLEVAARYPDQVLVLKHDREIAKLDPRPKGLQNRLICAGQTKVFPVICQSIFSNFSNKNGLTDHILNEQKPIVEYFDNLKNQLGTFRSVMDEAKRKYTVEELKHLRKQEPFPAIPLRVIAEEVFGGSAKLLISALGSNRLPSIENTPFSIQFRLALCHRLLVFKWIQKGGYENMTQEKYGNDFTDMSYAAYATFFDDLVTKDQKLMNIYLTAKRLLADMLKTDLQLMLKSCVRGKSAN